LLTKTVKVLVEAVAVLGLVAVLGFSGLYSQRRAAAAEAKLEVAQRDAKLATAAADAALAAAADSAAAARRAMARADSLQVRADSIDRLFQASRTRFETVAEAAPDTCAELVVLAAEALDRADEEIQLERAKAESARSAVLGLQFALTTVSDSLARLRDATTNLGSAARAATHTSFFDRIRPRLGVGAAAGVGPKGPDAIVGITVGWSF
ncbi:MAG TPA: hypothetical protein VF159_03305, partial [Gemmatimonadaceae bacterium]